MIHELKTKPEYFSSVRNGEKTFEVRKKDRPFEIGDYAALNEIDESGTYYTGRALLMRITYVLADEEFCKPGYVVLGLEPTHMIFAEPDNMAELLCPNNPREIIKESKYERYETKTAI